VQPLWKSYDSAISLLGIYAKKYKSAYNEDNCTAIFVASLFTIVRNCGIILTAHQSMTE
jgi:hypothetical protein